MKERALVAIDLRQQEELLLGQVIPAYDYMQGSLVSGYTDTADLDLIFVWDQGAVPQQREGVVAPLDEWQLERPFVVDYQDIHLERFVIAAQEYNVAHRTLADMAATARAVLDGAEVPGQQILDPLTAVSGFYYGRLLADRSGHAARLRAELAVFPARLQRETLRALRSHQESFLKDLHAFAGRGDWPMFWSSLVTAVQTALLALFSAQAVYFPGGKWLRAAILRFGLAPSVLVAFDRIWAEGASPDERIAGLQQLLALAHAAAVAGDGTSRSSADA